MTAAAACVQAAAALVAAVQHNCDLADAQHAREQGLCTYLLAMRELYRWSVGAPLGATLPRDAVGAWIAARERHWEQLLDASAAYMALPLAGGIDPFDEPAVNAALAALPGPPLVYGAGLGHQRAPLFFVAELAHAQGADGIVVVHAGRELARGLAAPPAASRQRQVIVRRDALRRWLWTRLEATAPRGDGFAALLRQLGGERAAAVETLAARQADLLVLHERGEIEAGALLSTDWEAMLLHADRRTELVLRALRDLLADALVTLAALAQARDGTGLALWHANLEGLRRRLAAGVLPGGEAGSAALAAALPAARARWHRQAMTLSDAWQAGGAAALAAAAARLAD